MTVYGLLTKMPGPAIVELGGHAGFDLVVIDTEHGAAGSEDLEHHLRAADSAGVEAIVRVGAPEPIETLRALDAGASGVIVPHVNDAAAAEAAVRAAHYPPVGERGLAVSTRAGHHGLSPVDEYVERALEDTLVVVQVEHAEALDNVHEIASSKRVDAVFLGPSDLSISLGHPGDTTHPDVAAAIDRVVEGVVGAGGAALCVLAGSEEEARSWEAKGARMVLFSASALLGGRLKQVLSELKPAGTGLPPAHADGSKGRNARRDA
jgi:4-hydroxy-2-oxoheptanedioate aldolase